GSTTGAGAIASVISRVSSSRNHGGHFSGLVNRASAVASLSLSGNVTLYSCPKRATKMRPMTSVRQPSFTIWSRQDRRSSHHALNSRAVSGLTGAVAFIKLAMDHLLLGG